MKNELKNKLAEQESTDGKVPFTGMLSINICLNIFHVYLQSFIVLEKLRFNLFHNNNVKLPNIFFQFLTFQITGT